MPKVLTQLGCALLVLLLGTPIASADVLRFLAADHDAAQARVDLIQQAECEICISYFTISNDPLAAMYLKLLRDAAQRNVRVRIVVDSAYNRIPPDVQSHLIRQGVQIREYHPFRASRPDWVNRRMHDKLMIADCCRMIVGSRNMDERHFGRAPDELDFLDLDVFLCGDVVEQACCYFEGLWNGPEVRETDLSPGLVKKVLRYESESSRQPGECFACGRCDWLDKAGPVSVDCRPLCFDTGNDWCAGRCPLLCVRFLCDPRGQKKNPRGISPQVFELLDQARSSIVIESPYFMLSHKLKQSLRDARARGVEVLVLTNSLDSTNQMLVYAEFANQKRELLRLGVKLWEYGGPDRLHAKSALIDGCTVIVGSYNFDPRAEHLNTELAVVVRDAQVARELAESVDQHLSLSYRLGPHGPIGEAGRNPGAPAWKILALQPMRIFAPLIKRSL